LPIKIRISRQRELNGQDKQHEWGKRNAFAFLVGKQVAKEQLGRQRHRWVDNIKMDLAIIGWSGTDWMDLAQNKDQWWALVNVVLNVAFHKIVGSVLVCGQTAASQKGLSSTEVVRAENVYPLKCSTSFF
jgi:hypothetical protein